jgi:RNA polymerase sigma-70 factor (ECF subfamily)
MGTRAGFSRLHEHRQHLERVAERILGRDPQVDDVVQEAYLAALRRGVNEELNPRAWLFRVTVNLARKVLRARARRDRREARWTFEGAQLGPVECALRRESSRLVSRALEELDAEQREALHLRFFEELDYPTMASRLSLREEAVRSRVRRALEVMRTTLGRHGLS